MDALWTEIGESSHLIIYSTRPNGNHIGQIITWNAWATSSLRAVDIRTRWSLNRKRMPKSKERTTNERPLRTTNNIWVCKYDESATRSIYPSLHESASVLYGLSILHPATEIMKRRWRRLRFSYLDFLLQWLWDKKRNEVLNPLYESS